jgi:hypothetical protein
MSREEWQKILKKAGSTNSFKPMMMIRSENKESTAKKTTPFWVITFWYRFTQAFQRNVLS